HAMQMSMSGKKDNRASAVTTGVFKTPSTSGYSAPGGHQTVNGVPMHPQYPGYPVMKDVSPARSDTSVVMDHKHRAETGSSLASPLGGMSGYRHGSAGAVPVDGVMPDTSRHQHQQPHNHSHQSQHPHMLMHTQQQQQQHAQKVQHQYPQTPSHYPGSHAPQKPMMPPTTVPMPQHPQSHPQHPHSVPQSPTRSGLNRSPASAAAAYGAGPATAQLHPSSHPALSPEIHQRWPASTTAGLMPRHVHPDVSKHVTSDGSQQGGRQLMAMQPPAGSIRTGEPRIHHVPTGSDLVGAPTARAANAAMMQSNGAGLAAMAKGSIQLGTPAVKPMSVNADVKMDGDVARGCKTSPGSGAGVPLDLSKIRPEAGRQGDAPLDLSVKTRKRSVDDGSPAGHPIVKKPRQDLPSPKGAPDMYYQYRGERAGDEWPPAMSHLHGKTGGAGMRSSSQAVGGVPAMPSPTVHQGFKHHTPSPGSVPFSPSAAGQVSPLSTVAPKLQHAMTYPPAERPHARGTGSSSGASSGQPQRQSIEMSFEGKVEDCTSLMPKLVQGISAPSAMISSLHSQLERAQHMQMRTDAVPGHTHGMQMKHPHQQLHHQHQPLQQKPTQHKETVGRQFEGKQSERRSSGDGRYGLYGAREEEVRRAKLPSPARAPDGHADERSSWGAHLVSQSSPARPVTNVPVDSYAGKQRERAQLTRTGSKSDMVGVTPAGQEQRKTPQADAGVKRKEEQRESYIVMRSSSDNLDRQASAAPAGGTGPVTTPKPVESTLPNSVTVSDSPVPHGHGRSEAGPSPVDVRRRSDSAGRDAQGSRPPSASRQTDNNSSSSTPTPTRGPTPSGEQSESRDGFQRPQQPVTAGSGGKVPSRTGDVTHGDTCSNDDGSKQETGPSPHPAPRTPTSTEEFTTPLSISIPSSPTDESLKKSLGVSSVVPPGAKPDHQRLRSSPPPSSPKMPILSPQEKGGDSDVASGQNDDPPDLDPSGPLRSRPPRATSNLARTPGPVATGPPVTSGNTTMPAGPAAPPPPQSSHDGSTRTQSQDMKPPSSGCGSAAAPNVTTAPPAAGEGEPQQDKGGSVVIRRCSVSGADFDRAAADIPSQQQPPPGHANVPFTCADIRPDGINRPDVIRRSSLDRPWGHQKNIPVANVAPFVHSKSGLDLAGREISDGLQPPAEPPANASSQPKSDDSKTEQTDETKPVSPDVPSTKSPSHTPRPTKQSQGTEQKKITQRSKAVKKSTSLLKKLHRMGKSKPKAYELEDRYKVLKSSGLSVDEQLDSLTADTEILEKSLSSKSAKQKRTKLKKKSRMSSSERAKTTTKDSGQDVVEGEEKGTAETQDRAQQEEKAKKDLALLREERAKRRALLRGKAEERERKSNRRQKPARSRTARRRLSSTNQKARELKRTALGRRPRR
ncbi:hypothetical protein BaRGS_00040500, partial [Batillaria attramentaria]